MNELRELRTTLLELITTLATTLETRIAAIEKLFPHPAAGNVVKEAA